MQGRLSTSIEGMLIHASGRKMMGTRIVSVCVCARTRVCGFTGKFSHFKVTGCVVTSVKSFGKRCWDCFKIIAIF